MVANTCVPTLGLLVVKEQRALSVKPDIVFLVREDTQRTRFTKFFVGNVIVAPYHILLMNDVKAYDTSVIIDIDYAVLAFAYRTDITLRNAIRII